MGRFREVTCANPECGMMFLSGNRLRKYCRFECGDKLRSKKYRDTHINILRERRIALYPSRKPVLMARHRAWVKKNREHVRSEARRWGRLHRDELRAYARLWYEAHKGNHKMYAANRRGWKDSTVVMVTEEEWQTLIKVYENRCAYCHRIMREPTQDHILPLSKGGDHSVENIVPACRPCNSAKKDKEVGEFLVWLDKNKA